MGTIAGIVLCGGQSSRMGRPKPWLPFGDELMLPRVVRLLSDVVSPVVAVAAEGQDLPPLPAGVIIVRDPLPDRGPLQALVAGLQTLHRTDGIDAAYASGCDVPLLRPQFVQRMTELLGDHQACVPRIGGRLHPLAAVYRLDALALAERQLEANQFSVTQFCSLLDTRIIEGDELACADPDFTSIRNINTPVDYAAALAVAGLHGAADSAS